MRRRRGPLSVTARCALVVGLAIAGLSPGAAGATMPTPPVIRESFAQPAGPYHATRCGSKSRTFLNPAWSPDSKQIVWTSSCNGAWDAEIWIAAASGSSARVLARSAPFVSQLRWLRAGGLVYTGVSSLWHLSQDGSKSLLVAHSDNQFTADAAGDRVAWGVAGCECQGPIVVKSLAAGWTRIVAGSGNFGDFDPTLSPNGQRVAFDRISCPPSARCGPTAGIWVAHISGGRPQQITRSGYTPQWSPDGRSILYNDGRGHLVAVTPKGRREKLLPGGGTATLASTFAWSPDSRSIAVWLQGPLLVVDVTTGRAHTVTTPADGEVTGFAWSPDSRSLLVPAKKKSACATLWLVQADGSGQHLLHRC